MGKRRNKTAILCSPQTTAFYTLLAHAYHARGDLRLAFLYIDGVPAAFTLCLLRGRRLYLIKTRLDERFQQFSPGLLVNLCTVERCFELGLETYDLLGADDRWKASFANATSDHVRLRSYRRRPVPLARYAARRFGRPTAQRLRSRLER
jgi:CelD/BcsL family acetyltransferase involved in cellulose biosynthesis